MSCSIVSGRELGLFAFMQKQGRRQDNPVGGWRILGLTKLLLIDNETDRAQQIERRLQLWGLECSTASSFLYALTKLEWQRPELVLVREGSNDDMTASEFCSTVKQDSGLRRIPLVLLAEAGSETVASDRRFDLVLEDLDERMLGAHLARFLRRIETNHEPEYDTLEDIPILGSTPTEVNIRDFARLVRHLSEGLKSGRLAVQSDVQPEQVFMILDHGQIVHAVFGGLEGSPAFRRLLDTFDGSKKLSCLFEEEPRWRIGSYPRSIPRSERQRLMDQVKQPDSYDTQVLKFRLPHH